MALPTGLRPQWGHVNPELVNVHLAPPLHQLLFIVLMFYIGVSLIDCKPPRVPFDDKDGNKHLAVLNLTQYL